MTLQVSIPTSSSPVGAAPVTPFARRLARLAVSLGLAGLVATTAAAPALAGDAVRYSFDAYANVVCDSSNATMSVSAHATTFQGIDALGAIVPTSYDDGQYMRYRVLVREDGQAAWTEIYTWSAWQLVRSKTGNGSITMVSPVHLGTSVVQGASGHVYEVLAQVDFWTGVSNVHDVPTHYDQAIVLNAFDTRYVTPGRCSI
jgi:hypothetical protein